MEMGPSKAAQADKSKYVWDGIDTPIAFDEKYDTPIETEKSGIVRRYYVPVSRYREEPIFNTKLSPIHMAALRRSLDLVRAYIRSDKVDLKTRTGEGRTALHLAVEARSIEMVRLLLDSPEMKTCLDAKDYDGWAPIHVASRFGDIEIVTLLLEAGANICLQTNTGFGGYSALHIAIAYDHEDLASFILSKSPSLVNCSASGTDGWLPLHEAAKRNNYRIAQELISKGAKINVPGRLCYSYTTQERDWPSTKTSSLQPLEISMIVAFMNSTFFQNSQNKNGCHPFPIAKLLLELGATFSTSQNEQSLVHLAAKSPYDDFLRLLLKSKRDAIDIPDNRGSTPLHYAVFKEKDRCVRVLLELGAKTETLNSNGYNALHAAILRSNITIMDMLLKHGADPNSRDSKQQTPLHLATISNNVEAVSLLMEYGADANAITLDNYPTPASIEDKFTELSTVPEGSTSMQWLHEPLSPCSTTIGNISISPQAGILITPSITARTSDSERVTKTPSRSLFEVPKNAALRYELQCRRATLNSFRCRFEKCDRNFTDRHNRNRHERVVHACKDTKSSIPCEVPGCGMQFTRVDNMRKHLRKFHRVVGTAEPSRKKQRIDAPEKNTEHSMQLPAIGTSGNAVAIQV